MTRAKAGILIVLLASGACTGARPWERETLAAKRMQFDPDPVASGVEQHVYNYREGSIGGYGGGGGGCGCN